MIIIEKERVILVYDYDYELQESHMIIMEKARVIYDYHRKGKSHSSI
jgi:hypothetical protein